MRMMPATISTIDANTSQPEPRSSSMATLLVRWQRHCAGTAGRRG
jgi:hypothetical protein